MLRCEDLEDDAGGGDVSLLVLLLVRFCSSVLCRWRSRFVEEEVEGRDANEGDGVFEIDADWSRSGSLSGAGTML